jgi:hypothetical protein
MAHGYRSALVVAFVLASATAHADRWNAGDTAMQVTFTGITLLDWHQTLVGLDRGFAEVNPIMGDLGEGKIPPSLYFPSLIAAHTAVAYLLPRPYRTAWQCVWIGVQAKTVYENVMSLGVGGQW